MNKDIIADYKMAVSGNATAADHNKALTTQTTPASHIITP